LGIIAPIFEKKYMEQQFLTGNKVRLVSGGPDMTIRGIHYDVLANEYRNNMFDCIWFEQTREGKREVHYCPFYANELIKIKELVNKAAN
jgi:uncharacterized protein YodC (DUF2158 family)